MLKQASADAVDADIVVGGINIAATELAALVAMLNPDRTIMAKTKTVVLLAEQGRTRIRTQVGANTALAEYRVTLTVERDPVSDEERAACSARDESGKARKTAQLEQAEKDRKALIAGVRAETRQNLLDGVQAGTKLAEDARRAAMQAQATLQALAQSATGVSHMA